MTSITRSAFCSFAILMTFLVGCSKKDGVVPPAPPPVITITPPADFGFKVVGYMPYYRDPATIPDAKFKMANVINYAFFTINSSGGLVLNSPSVFTAVIAKAKANNAKIFMSINGASADFKNMAATAEGRTNFIKAIMSSVRMYALHGVDMDWEFPSTQDGTDQTFTLLMKQLSDSCHRDAKYYLTAAITAGKYAGSFRDAIRTELFASVDWFNIMAYDDFSASAPYRHHSDLTLAQTCLNYWVNTRAMPKEKAVLGLPAYGRPSGITQTGTVMTYAGILAQGGSASSDSAIVINTAYPNPYTVYYNGQPTIKKKTMLAKQMGNGVMLWEKGQDAMDANSLLKAVCDTIGRAY